MSKEIDETYSKTKNAIERSKVFLNSKLLPDLEQATSYLAHLQQSRENYIELRKKVDELRIRQNHSSHQDDIRLKEHTAEEKDYDDASSVPIMAPIGRGVQISTQIDPKSLLILVSSGLKESVQDWQVDSGLYLQLDQEETANFAETKIGILERRVKLAKDKEAVIEGHVELTKSIQQLEQLLANPQSSFLDFLRS